MFARSHCALRAAHPTCFLRAACSCARRTADCACPGCALAVAVCWLCPGAGLAQAWRSMPWRSQAVAPLLQFLSLARSPLAPAITHAAAAVPGSTGSTPMQTAHPAPMHSHASVPFTRTDPNADADADTAGSNSGTTPRPGPPSTRSLPSWYEKTRSAAVPTPHRRQRRRRRRRRRPRHRRTRRRG